MEEAKQPAIDEKKYLKQVTIKENEIDWTKVDRNTYDIISQRIEDYREACLYMKEVVIAV